jgi:ligand-binding sensor domain-containing protein
MPRHSMKGLAMEIIFLSLLCFPLFPQIKANNVNSTNSNFVADHQVWKVFKTPIELPDKSFVPIMPKVIFQDRRGLIYLADFNQLFTYDEQQDRWNLLANPNLGLTGAKIITQGSDDKIWVLSGSGDLSVGDGTKWEIMKFEDAGVFKTNIIFSAKDNGLWAVTNGTLSHFDNEKRSREMELPKMFFEITNGYVKQGMQGSDGAVWLGVGNGLLKYDEVKKEWTSILTPQMIPNPEHMLEDRERNLWFANPLGNIAVYERKNGNWIHYHLNHKFPEIGAVRGMVEDAQGKILFATTDGVASFDKSKLQWKLFTHKNSALPSRAINCIYKDRTNRIWIGTPKGIVVLQP